MSKTFRLGGFAFFGDENRVQSTCTLEYLRALVDVRTKMVTRPVTTSEPVTASGPWVPVSQEILDDVAHIRDFLIRDFLTDLWAEHEYTLTLRVEGGDDDVAVVLWQAANTLEYMERMLVERDKHIEELRSTARAMFGDVDPYAIADLLGIPTEC